MAIYSRSLKKEKVLNLKIYTDQLLTVIPFVNMKCAIMQPHYFPWAGYFNLISKVNETYVFLDDVQFSKNSWQSRNQILVNGKKKWITDYHYKAISFKNQY